MNEQDKLEIISKSSRASFALDNIGPFLEERKASILSSLKNNFRSGKMDLSVFIEGVSSLCVLEDLENDLKSTINRGKQYEL